MEDKWLLERERYNKETEIIKTSIKSSNIETKIDELKKLEDKTSEEKKTVIKRFIGNIFEFAFVSLLIFGSGHFVCNFMFDEVAASVFKAINISSLLIFSAPTLGLACILKSELKEIKEKYNQENINNEIKDLEETKQKINQNISEMQKEILIINERIINNYLEYTKEQNNEIINELETFEDNQNLQEEKPKKMILTRDSNIQKK